MLPAILVLAISLPQPEVNSFAQRVALNLPARQEGRAMVRVEDPGKTGAALQLERALHDAVRLRGYEVVAASESAQVHAWLSMRRGRPLVTARVLVDSREAGVAFSEIAPASSALTVSAPLAVTIRTRTLLASELPVLDVEADSAGNLFVLHANSLRVYNLNAPGLPLKSEVGLDTGAERLRDPLVRLLARDAPRQLEVYSSAPTVPAPPPVSVEGYTLKIFGSSAPLRLPHPARGVTAQLQAAAGRNHLRTAAIPDLYGIAPVASALSAHWVALDGSGRLRLLDAAMRTIATTPGEFGGDVAATSVPCAGTLVLAAGSEIEPTRDRIHMLLAENDRLMPYTTIDIEGAVRRLKALASSGAPEQRRVLAVADGGSGARIEEIELRCQ